MVLTVHGLLNDDATDIASYYQLAASRWRELLDREEIDPGVLSGSALAAEQLNFFEKRCGGQRLGQEIMVAAGIGHLYSAGEGFDGRLARAHRVVEALKTSMCSIEVKWATKRIAALYVELEDMVEGWIP